MEEVMACPACGWAKPEGEPLTGFQYSYDTCPKCGLLYLPVRMTDEQTRVYYQGLYRTALGAGEDGCKPMDLVNQELSAVLYHHMLKPHIGGCKRNLEIGCSAGFLMERLVREGICSVGVEPEVRNHMIEPARHFELYEDISEVPSQTFDLISMSHVFEHLNHPHTYLKNLIENYARGGSLIMIAVPNAGSTELRFHHHHPTAWTIEALAGLLNHLACEAVTACHYNTGSGKPDKNLFTLWKVKDAIEAWKK